jgi:protoporphyrinogen oxidase
MEFPLDRQKPTTENLVVIIGAGPAGLSAAFELATAQYRPIVLERGDKVGGLARTESYKGFHFDMGGHRFFTKNAEINRLWHEILGQDFLRRPRLSRIYYKRNFFNYPLKPMNALVGLGLGESLRVVLSYLRWQVVPYRQEESFEQWVTNRFGKRLFDIFFKSYTEKIWGISCSELKAEWAAQRIKDLSLKSVLLSMFVKPKVIIKSLIDEFDYPRRGPGMLWNKVKEQIELQGGKIRTNAGVVAIRKNANGIHSVVVSSNETTEVIHGTHFISSMPVTEFIRKIEPPPPPKVLQAVEKLKYRDFLTVCLIVNKPAVFPDNWIYVHDPGVKVGRIQNFKNWSPEMVPDQAKTSLGLEYFCTEGDELWQMADEDLIQLGKLELGRIGVVQPSEIEDGCVFRVPKAYPIYDSEYREYLTVVREYLATLKNVQTIGRNGLHRYNNQDHSMLTGMLAVRNLMFGEHNDLWSVNGEQDFHEEVSEKIEPAPMLAAAKGALNQVFPKLDGFALGVSAGTMTGILLFLGTIFLLLKSGAVVGPNLQLLDQYFPGYSLTFSGSLLGLAYGFVTGFVGGWGFAFLRNTLVFLYMALLHRRAEHQLLKKFLEYV